MPIADIWIWRPGSRSYQTHYMPRTSRPQALSLPACGWLDSYNLLSKSALLVMGHTWYIGTGEPTRYVERVVNEGIME